MQIKALSSLPFDTILNCFYESFSDYFVDVKMPGDFWQKRWKTDKVDFQFSYGMFDEDQLVGFILNGIGYRDGIKTAFNAGTGVIPAYRGRRIVKTLYDHFLPILKKEGIEACALEVICANTKAIKAYESVGMKITRTYKCYGGEFSIPTPGKGDFIFTKVDTPFWETYATFNDLGYSWGNSRDAVELNNDLQYFEMSNSTQLLGYFIIDPTSGSIAQFEVKDNNWEEYGDSLFAKIAEISPRIKINNQDDRNKERIQYLNKINLPNPIDQFEMEMKM